MRAAPLITPTLNFLTPNFTAFHSAASLCFCGILVGRSRASADSYFGSWRRRRRLSTGRLLSFIHFLPFLRDAAERKSAFSPRRVSANSGGLGGGTGEWSDLLRWAVTCVSSPSDHPQVRHSLLINFRFPLLRHSHGLGG